MGFIIYYLVLIANPMGRILVRRKSFRNNLEILCHPICNWLYMWMTQVIPSWRTWLIHMWLISCVRHDVFICGTWHITRSRVGHHVSMCAAWIIHICDMTHSYVWHDSFICRWDERGDVSHTWMKSCPMCEWVMSHMRMSHVSYGNESCLMWMKSCAICEWVMSHVWISRVSHVNEVMSHVSRSHVPYANESCLICEWVMSHMGMSHVSYVN